MEEGARTRSQSAAVNAGGGTLCSGAAEPNLMHPDCAHRSFTLFKSVHGRTRRLHTILEVAGEYIDAQNIDFLPVIHQRRATT